MLQSLLARLTAAPSQDPLPPEDSRLALTALMLRVAKADGHVDEREIARMDEILAEKFGLDAAGAAALRDEAGAVEAAAQDTVPLTRLIKDTVPYEDRIGVVEALWDIALADQNRSDDENAMLRLVVNLIGVPDPESGLARQRVLNRLAQET